MEEAIQKAIEGGYGEFLENREGVYEFEQFYLKHPEKALLHPSFWQALGKAEGWGEWTMKLADVVHDWEVEFYKPDTAKTPVYICKKCYARKELDIVSVEYEYQYEEVKEDFWTGRSVISHHGGYRRTSWKDQWHSFIDHLASGGDINKFFEDLLSHEKTI